MVAQKSVPTPRAESSDAVNEQTTHMQGSLHSGLHNRTRSYITFCKGVLSRLIPSIQAERALSRGMTLRDSTAEQAPESGATLQDYSDRQNAKRWGPSGKPWQSISDILLEHKTINYISYLSPLYILQILAYLFSRFLHYQKQANILTWGGKFPHFMLPYPIKDTFFTPVTAIFFTRSKRFHVPICLKEWPRCTDSLLLDEPRSFEHLQEGLAFNRRCAPGVYYGIAPMKPDLQNIIVERGWLITHPQEHMLQKQTRYAIVMKRLPAQRRLDNYLSPGKLANEEGMHFLAREVARMHQQLEKSRDEKGEPGCLGEKLKMNIDLFNQTLEHLEKIEKQPGQASGEQMMGRHNQCREIGALMQEAYKKGSEAEYFQQRHQQGHIKRCHGDLKTVNLWVQPGRVLGLNILPQRLLALDCIDFNPLLCHIDTLSDIAMLAVDMEARMKLTLRGRALQGEPEHLVEVLLQAYREEMAKSEKLGKGTERGKLATDKEVVDWLLEYYMTEKAMACAHAFFLYYKEPEIGELYLDVALRHMQKLQELPIHQTELVEA